MDTKRLTENESQFRQALAIAEDSYGPNHPEVATALANLAGVLFATGRLAEAEPLLRRVLTIYETTLGSAHHKVATALNNVAELLLATKRWPRLSRCFDGHLPSTRRRSAATIPTSPATSIAWRCCLRLPTA